MVKVAELFPSATTTLDGTDAFGLLESSPTETPPDPAGLERVTVPKLVNPTTTELGLRTRLLRGPVVTRSDAVALTFPELAVITTVLFDETLLGEIVN